eukprot:8736434-Ditylum_brightwellii.AAC.1
MQFRHTTKSKMYDRKVQIMAAADEGAGFSETWLMQKKKSVYVAQTFNVKCFCCYMCPQEVIHNNGRKFIVNEFQELLHSCGVKDAPMKMKNPQVNLTVERM